MAATDHGGNPRVPVTVLVNGWVTLVVLAAVTLVAWSTVERPPGTDDVGTAVGLAALSVGYDWWARRVEVLRRRMSSGPYVTMDSVWILAAACDLPLPLTAGVVVVIQVHAGYQARRSGTARPWTRDLFNVGAIVLPAAAASELIIRADVFTMPFGSPRDLLTPLVLAGAVLTYAVLNTAIVGVVISLSTGERRIANLVGTSTENLVELASLTLGVLVGVALTFDVWLALLAVPILVLLQRIALVDHLESAASEDSKTGLLNAAAWNYVAERDLERAKARQAPAAVMVVDLDHFKRVNDTFGHLTGDVVLRAVAECMRTMLRDRDQVARFGGEEFVAFLPGADAGEALKVAERLRQRIAETVTDPIGRLDGRAEGAVARERVRITVSIGVAAHPEHGETLVDLLARADEALYAAKDAGRNRIHCAA